MTGNDEQDTETTAAPAGAGPVAAVGGVETAGWPAEATDEAVTCRYWPDPGDRVVATLVVTGPRSRVGTVRSVNPVTEAVELTLPKLAGDPAVWPVRSVLLRPGPYHTWTYAPAPDDASNAVLLADARAVLDGPDPVGTVARLILRVRMSGNPANPAGPRPAPSNPPPGSSGGSRPPGGPRHPPSKP